MFNFLFQKNQSEVDNLKANLGERTDQKSSSVKLLPGGTGVRRAHFD